MIVLASFLVLFLEVALIRWMPSYIRLLSFFSNFILLASFLGIGVGCLLVNSRRRLFFAFPALLALVIGAVFAGRLEISVPSATSIYFSSGTDDPVRLVESTLMLPVLFAAVAALFTALAHRMAREMSVAPPLRAYTLNLAGSLGGVLVFALCSWLQAPPAVWFGLASAAALPLLLRGAPGEMQPSRGIVVTSLALLAIALGAVHAMAAGSTWSPYYKVVMRDEGGDKVVEVNEMFHQSMAPLAEKEYFYQWPYMAFGDTFDEVLVLGAGSGTDVAAALAHGATHVDAVEIDPAIIRLGREQHPDRPYSDPRVTVHNDDARHFLRTTSKKYDLVVFALIDSLTLQSSFAGVRLETPPDIPSRVAAFGQPDGSSPARRHLRDPGIEPATDDWPFLYLKYRHIPSHYLWAIAMILAISVGAVLALTRGQAGGWSWQFFLLGAGFMMLETKSIIQLALLWGSTWVVASLAIASVLIMALVANFIVARRDVRRPWAVGAVLLGLLAVNYVVPVGAIGFDSLVLESLFHAVLIFSPVVCAGLLFGSAIRHSHAVARDYGTNLLGAMAGGVGEYLSLVTGFSLLLLVIAAIYVGAILARQSAAAPQLASTGRGTA